MRPLDDVFPALATSAFRRRFHLAPKDRAYLETHGLAAVMVQAEELIARRLAPAHPPNDGKQTPFRGHPVFVAQHATATCCRGCLAKWHDIPRGAELTDEQRAHVIAALERWLRAELVAVQFIPRSHEPTHQITISRSRHTFSTPMLQTICVFCASSPGADPRYLEAARSFGELLARTGRRIVYGGGNTGLMGALADGALSARGEIVGVMPRHLVEREVVHRGLTRLDIVSSMHERKARLAEMADAFVALPGGLGTLEEFTEIWTWGQLGLHRKPYGILDVAGYYAPLLDFLDHALAQGFVRPEHRAMVHVAEDPAALLDAMVHAPPPALPKYLDRGTT